MARKNKTKLNMSLKNLSLLIGLGCLTASRALAGDQPQGKLIELHSCEVYAGPCMIGSEAALGGRQTVQVWDIAGGSWQGVNLSGLQVALLQTSSENLAEAKTHAERAVVYLPETASKEQRTAVVAWLKSRNVQLAKATIQTRVAPISITTSDNSVKFSAGDFVSFQTVPLGNCASGACGEELWYEPSTPTSFFTVAVNAGSQVNEPLLGLKWTERGQRSVFLAHFGETAVAKNLFVQATDWCAANGKLF